MKSNYEERMKSRRAGKQLTLHESEVCVKAKQAEAEIVIHDFTRAIIHCQILNPILSPQKSKLILTRKILALKLLIAFKRCNCKKWLHKSCISSDTM